MNRSEWEEKGQDIVKEMVERYHKRKMLEVGGFTPEEINALTTKELEYMLRLMIKKGRAFGSLKGADVHGQRNAAQAWLDALEIHERCPASHNLKDPAIIFPVFSDLAGFIKGGKIIQNADCSFEQKLPAKDARDSERLGDPVHSSRALAALCEVRARAGKFTEALEILEDIKSVYDPKRHDPDKYPGLDDAVQSLQEEGNAITAGFFDGIFYKLGWASNTMNADLYLRVARKLHAEGGDLSKLRTLVSNGITAGRKAEGKMKYDNCKVHFPAAYEIHVPVFEVPLAFAFELGMDIPVEPVAYSRAAHQAWIDLFIPVLELFGLKADRTVLRR
jgi:hypothetical protein